MAIWMGNAIAVTVGTRCRVFEPCEFTVLINGQGRVSLMPDKAGTIEAIKGTGKPKRKPPAQSGRHEPKRTLLVMPRDENIQRRAANA